MSNLEPERTVRSGDSIVFKAPVVLSAEAHRTFGYVPESGSNTIQLPLFVPIASFEFFKIASCYPILFFNDEDVFPVAITAPISKDGAIYGKHPTDVAPYLPSILQLYPFILEKLPDRDAGVLVFDEKSGRVVPLSENRSAAALFDGAGTPTETLHRIASSAAQVYDGRRRAASFALALKTAGLLTPSALEFNEIGPKDSKQRRFYMINEPAYRALPKDTVEAWFVRGWLDLATLVIATQHNWLNYRHRPVSPPDTTVS